MLEKPDLSGFFNFMPLVELMDRPEVAVEPAPAET
jgi:hypothetical protein